MKQQPADSMRRPRGVRRRISRSRQTIVDLMYFSRTIPLIVVERSMPFGKLAKARQSHPERPPWSALFAKAFALVAHEVAALRQIYFSFPIPYLYEYEESAVSIARELDVGAEMAVLPVRIRSPDTLPLAFIRYKINDLDDAQLWQKGFYRTIALTNYLPFFLRRPIWWVALNNPRFRKRIFGTFAISSVGALGADAIVALAPFTSLLTYGPLGDDGKLRVRLMFDHRVYDGATAARVLARLEEVLLGAIYEEIAPKKDGANL
jgi:hypothetical protein